MPISVKVAGAWKTVAAPSVRVGGAWKPLTKAFVRVAGAWKETYSAASLVVSLDTTILSYTGSGTGPFDTSRVAATPSGGTGPYTLHWEYVSGDGTLSPNDSNIGNPYFIGSGTPTETKTAVWHCKATDNLGAVAYSANVTISISFTAALSASLSPGTLDSGGTGNGPFGTGLVTASASGGTPGYSYLWEYVSGDATLTPSSTTATNPYFTGSGTAPETKTATWRCKITDSVGTVAYTGNVVITLIFGSDTLTASASPSSAYADADNSGVVTATTGSITATPSGGTPGYSYLWQRVSGDAGTNPVDSAAASTAFERTSGPSHVYNSVWRCRVTDTASNVAYTDNVAVQLVFLSGA